MNPGKSEAVNDVKESVRSEHSKSEVINSISERQREPENQNITEDPVVSRDPVRCRHCKSSPCLHGQEITPDHLSTSRNFLGCPLIYCGTRTKRFSERYKQRIGYITNVSRIPIREKSNSKHSPVVGYKPGLNIKWNGDCGKVKKTCYSVTAKNDGGVLENQFQFHCRTSSKCPNCYSWPCLHGADYENYNKFDKGRRVEYVGPDKNISNCVGEVKNFKKGFLVVKFIGKKKLKDDQGMCLFKYSCCNHGNFNNNVIEDEDE